MSSQVLSHFSLTFHVPFLDLHISEPEKLFNESSFTGLAPTYLTFKHLGHLAFTSSPSR